LIAHHNGLEILCGDIGNAFITSDCLEKIYSITVPELAKTQFYFLQRQFMAYIPAVGPSGLILLIFMTT
jgi:hypothetical protein